MSSGVSNASLGVLGELSENPRVVLFYCLSALLSLKTLELQLILLLETKWTETL